MKKLVSVFIAIVMMFSTMCVCAIPAFASTQWEPRPYAQDTLGCVNGEPGDIYSDYDASSKEITYSYNGDGTVTDWELPLLEEGKDYEIVSKEGNKFTIKKLNDETVIPYVNAVVEFKQNEVTSDNQHNDNTDADEAITAKTENSDKWNSKDIVLIGAAVIAAAGASLIIIKKKKTN